MTAPFLWCFSMMASALTLDTVAWLLALGTPSRSDAARCAPVTSPPDAQQLLAALLMHGVAPLALNHVSAFPALQALEPPLRAAQADNARRALTCVKQLTGIGQAFDAAKVTWCVLKGVPLALRHYGDLAARRVGDIDILVAPDQVAVADTVLRECGWHRAGPQGQGPLPAPHYWHEQRYSDSDGLTLELHHRPHPNPHLLALPTATLLARTERISLGSAAVPVLDRVSELLYLSTHGCRHAWFRLLWVCDIAAVTATSSPAFMDATRVAAVELGLMQPLVQALMLAERLLGATAPAWAHALHARSARQRRLQAFALESLWCARDAAGNPVQRTRSSLLTALYQRTSPRFWAWELALRARHEHQHRLATA